ncbi:MAG: radical SAM protein [Candidatus Nanoarchaeia archaeon]
MLDFPDVDCDSDLEDESSEDLQHEFKGNKITLPKINRKIDARLRKETIIECGGKEKNIWLLYDSKRNLDIQINDPEDVYELAKIFLWGGAKRDKNLETYLSYKGYFEGKRNLKAWWLPAVKDALSSPVKLFYNPSGKCPNKCLTCFSDDYRRFSLEDSVAKETMDQIVNLPIFWMNLGGCELTFYPLYFEFAKKAIDNGIQVSSAFSGVGLTKDLAEKIKDLGIKAKVSLDGPKKINDIQRPGTYEPAINAIETFRELNYPVRINMVHTSLNNQEETIDEMFELAVKHGAAGIDFSIVRPKGSAITNNLMIPIEDYKNGKVKSVINRFINHPYIKQYGLKAHVNRNLLTLDKVEPKPCQILGVHGSCGRYTMGINMDGTIDGCIFLKDEYIPKTNVNSSELFTNSDYILNVWQNDKTFAKIREYTKKEPCDNCKKKKIEFARGCQACADYYGGVDPATYLH